VRSTNNESGTVPDDVIWSSRSVDFGEIVNGGGFYKLHIRFALKTTPPFAGIRIVCMFIKLQWFFHELTLAKNFKNSLVK
jgi:hypothetical protein